MFGDFNFSREENAITTKHLLPTRIVLSEGAEDAEDLLSEHPLQAAVGVTVPGCTLREGGYIILDFGSELQGGVSITIDRISEKEAHLAFTFGESVSEAMSSVDVKNASNHHALRDFVYRAIPAGTFRVGGTGFRFLRLRAVGADIKMASVKAEFRYRDIPYRGSFECSDERLNKIWKTAAYTTHLCMQEYLWDGIKRDRLVWIGDSNAEINTVSAVFGSNEVVPKSLDFIRDITPRGAWMNGIPAYSMWWIIDHLELYMQTGDTEYLMSQREYMTALVRQILDNIHPDGTTDFGAGFVDWSSNNTPYMEAGQQAMVVLSLDAAVKIFEIYGDNMLAAECKKSADICRTHSYIYDGNKQVAALVSLAGIEDAKKINDEVIAPGGASGFSTFLGYYGLLAMEKAGNTAGALDVIRNYWGAMLDLGATTFWEDFDMEWLENSAPITAPVPEGMRDIHGDFGKFCYEGFRHSLCHGWASGPAPFLSRAVLGVKILEAGCRRVSVKPNLAGLDFVCGTYPTPYGEIKVEAVRTSDGIRTNIDAPNGVEIV